MSALPVTVGTVTGSAASTPPVVAGGGFHTCAATSGGGAECWGQNSDGQLGDGTTTARSNPVAVVGLASGVTSVATGLAHSCAVVSGGVVCWGSNADGQLGNGTTQSSPVPVPVTGLNSGVLAVAAGFTHTCALRSNETVLCWGANGNGQLGDGTTHTRTRPVKVNAVTGVRSITAGAAHSCAATGTGAALCWGNNASGQLGDGTTTQRTSPVGVVGLSSQVSAITAGRNHTCAVTAAGAAKCWGQNRSGQLGDGTSTQRLSPVDVLNLGSGVASLLAGGDHTCAVIVGGAADCWGSNGHGELGNGSTSARTRPVAVFGLTANVASIAPGQFHTCAVVADAPRCWGDNTYGQLGAGTTATRLTPVAAWGLAAGVVGITAGGYHSCALTSRHGAKCWGDNEDGQLGIGTKVEQNIPVTVSGLSSQVAAISAGEFHTCALTTVGGVKCWGSNSDGQVGDGTNTDRSTPVDVVGLTSGVAQVAAGHHHACALASGGVWCWGDNTYGQLGDGTSTASGVPVPVAGLGGPVVALTGGGDHTCALLSSGGVQCWGANGYGQLGDGTTVQESMPVGVVGLGAAVAQVSAGGLSTCVRSVSGGVQCWGDDENGQLGDGGTTSQSMPVDVLGLSEAVPSISAGGLHACAVTPVGGASCWGRNGSGEIGDGTTTDRSTPTDVSGLASGVRLVAGGIAHTCALTTGGAVECWGRNDSGQTGDGTSTYAVLPLAVVGFG